MTSVHGPRFANGTNESVGEPTELDAKEEHLKEIKVVNKTVNMVSIFSSHEPEVRDKNPETLASSLKKLQVDVDELKTTHLKIKPN
ncbi:hypothetical protein PanWU01x14_148820 [Parasponia andersonii]|uniref:Uncharacterized protein n=1 Tax=Parasponia andersonii TaxID=3476 RepID=A0A2P5CJ68_PARAD|nr:hypothetical protein PanWU01x14_148820 [Parasponia andersonii]